MAKKIVVLGAGYAGILTAKKLAKKLKKNKDVEITIIDKNPFHTMLTELHEVAGWRVEEDSIKIDLKKVFAGRDVKVVLDCIVEKDYANNKLIGENGEYDYDYLILASGSQPTFFGVTGAQENAFLLWSYDDAVKLRDHVMEMFRQAAKEPNEAKRRKLLSFCIVGAGFTGVEMAGELAELVPFLCKRFEIDPSYVSIVDMDVLDRMVPILPEKLSGKVKARLEKMGVKVLLGAGVSAVGEDYVEYKVKAEGENAQARRDVAGTVIWTAGIEGSEIAKASTELEIVGRGRIQTDQYLRSTKHQNIFIGGDNIFFIPEGEKMAVPQMVENCEACADTISHNLICDMTKSGEMEKYAPKFHGVMVCIGGRYGVANVGAGKMFVNLPSFLAMLSKHFINVIYFIQVLGWNKVYSYIYHEFFTIRNCRSFLGGHFSNRTPSFMLAPLRVFLGFYWVYEGWMKITEGWLNKPMLTEFFSGANNYYAGLLTQGANAFNASTIPQMAAATAVDAVSSATGSGTFIAAPGAAIISEMAHPVLINWDIFGFIRFILVNAGEVASKLQIRPVDWLINDIILPNDGFQMTFQIVIVVLEILIGLALMAGLFTFLSSGVSLILQIMFLSSTGLYMSTWWMAFAAIALLFRGGQTLGLDYYVMPAISRWWKNRKFARKWYIYND